MSMWPGMLRSSTSTKPSVRVRSRQDTPGITRLNELDERIDKLALVNMAMWQLIQEKTSLTELDLLEKVQEMDLKDGVPDGKVTRTVRRCRKCNRVMHNRHNHCLYCGAPEMITSAFDTIT